VPSAAATPTGTPASTARAPSRGQPSASCSRRSVTSQRTAAPFRIPGPRWASQAHLPGTTRSGWATPRARARRIPGTIGSLVTPGAMPAARRARDLRGRDLRGAGGLGPRSDGGRGLRPGWRPARTRGSREPVQQPSPAPTLPPTGKPPAAQPPEPNGLPHPTRRTCQARTAGVEPRVRVPFPRGTRPAVSGRSRRRRPGPPDAASGWRASSRPVP
jgi:hypothetical protein